MIRTKWGRAVTGAVVLGVIGIAGLSASGRIAVTRVASVRQEPAPAWVHRVALVDEALERSDLSRAIDEWRDAYGAALKNGGSAGLVAVGDRAVRLAEVWGESSDLRTEAKNVYVHAALRASTERSRTTILAIVQRLARLGDPDRAGQVREIAGRLT